MNYTVTWMFLAVREGKSCPLGLGDRSYPAVRGRGEARCPPLTRGRARKEFLLCSIEAAIPLLGVGGGWTTGCCRPWGVPRGCGKLSTN